MPQPRDARGVFASGPNPGAKATQPRSATGRFGPTPAHLYATAAAVAAYLTDPTRTLPTTVEFLTRDPFRQMVYVRWPNGSVRWETIRSLEARGITVPDQMVLDPVPKQTVLEPARPV